MTYILHGQLNFGSLQTIDNQCHLHMFTRKCFKLLMVVYHTRYLSRKVKLLQEI